MANKIQGKVQHTQCFADYSVINRNGSRVYDGNGISLMFRSFFFLMINKTKMKTKVSKLHRSSHSHLNKSSS